MKRKQFGYGKLLLCLLAIQLSLFTQAQVEVKNMSQGPRHKVNGYFGNVQDSGLKLFITSFMKVRDSADLTPFYFQHRETKESYRFYTETVKLKHSLNWSFEKTPADINLDSFLNATETLFHKRMRWIYTKCVDSLYMIGGLDSKSDFKSIYSDKFSEGDIIEFAILFAGKKERYAWFRLYYYNSKWHIRFSTTHCEG